jgi:hypothetical protein
VVCEAFGCTPDVAERQDWHVVNSILRYRAAKAAHHAFLRGTLADEPALQALYSDLVAARNGDEPGALAELLDQLEAEHGDGR